MSIDLLCGNWLKIHGGVPGWLFPNPGLLILPKGLFWCKRFPLLRDVPGSSFHGVQKVGPGGGKKATEAAQTVGLANPKAARTMRRSSGPTATCRRGELECGQPPLMRPSQSLLGLSVFLFSIAEARYPFFFLWLMQGAQKEGQNLRGDPSKRHSHVNQN